MPPMQIQITAPPAAAPAQTTCLNCGTELAGEYCHGCGQHHAESRLTLRTVSREFVERFLSLERGLLRTFVEMTTDPGGVVRRYAAGQRRRYVSPLAYLLIGIGVVLVGYELVEPQLRVWMQARVAESMDELNRGIRQGSGQATAGLSADQIRRYTETMLLLSKKTTLTSLAIALPFSALLRLFFRKSGVNIAETTAFTFFCFGHLFLIAALFTTPLLLAGVDPEWVTQGSLLLYFVVPGFASLGFFGRRLGTVVKTLVAMAISYMTFAMVLATGVTLYVVLTS